MNPRLFVIAAAVFVFAAGAVFLATRDIPAPRHTIEKVIANDRLLK